MFRTLWSTLHMAVAILSWLVATIILGGALVWHATVRLVRLPFVFRTELHCPRGHSVPTYGRSQCRRCGAIREGYLFRACPGCAMRPAFLVCPRCGLAVWSLLR